MKTLKYSDNAGSRFQAAERVVLDTEQLLFGSFVAPVPCTPGSQQLLFGVPPEAPRTFVPWTCAGRVRDCCLNDGAEIATLDLAQGRLSFQNRTALVWHGNGPGNRVHAELLARWPATGLTTPRNPRHFDTIGLEGGKRNF